MEYSCEIVLYHISYIDGNFVKLVVGAHYNRLSKFGVACCHNIHITGKFGGELNLVVWQFIFATTKLKSTNISYLQITLFIWWSLIPNCQFKSANILQWWIGVQPPKFNSHQYFRPHVYGNNLRSHSEDNIQYFSTIPVGVTYMYIIYYNCTDPIATCTTRAL